MKITFLSLACSVALASCATTDLQSSLSSICAGGETGFAILEPFIAAGKLKPKTEAAAIAARDSLTDLCANKEQATLASVLVAASTAALTISTAVREAKRAE